MFIVDSCTSTGLSPLMYRMILLLCDGLFQRPHCIVASWQKSVIHDDRVCLIKSVMPPSARTRRRMSTLSSQTKSRLDAGWRRRRSGLAEPVHCETGTMDYTSKIRALQRDRVFMQTTHRRASSSSRRTCRRLGGDRVSRLLRRSSLDTGEGSTIACKAFQLSRP